jgi:hypothetical protein
VNGRESPQKIRTSIGMFRAYIRTTNTNEITTLVTVALNKMRKKNLILIATATMILALNIAGGTDDPSLWTELNGFNRRLDHGRLKTPFVDPDHPPAVELIFLSWNGHHLIVGCDFHNLRSEIVKIEGREVTDDTGSGSDFFPYATLEVSNNKDYGWTGIGTSPYPLNGREVAIFAPPNPPNQPVVAYTGSFEINLDAFRPVVGKFKFGRVVLKDGGGTSQIIVLTDLLPPDKAENN